MKRYGDWRVESGLVPRTRGEAHVLFSMLRDTMAAAVVGQDEQIDALALVGVRHLARNLVPPAELLRVLVLGPAGGGKSLLIRTFVEALGLPHVHVPAYGLAEMNWSGSDLGDFIGRLYEDAGLAGTVVTARLAERAIVVIDGLDTLRLAGRYTNANTRDYQLGRQQGLIPLFGDGVIPIERNGRSVSWPSRDALVIATAILADLPGGVVSVEALTDWGMIPQLADRIGAATTVRLNAPRPKNIPLILERNLDPPKQAFALFGYDLRISPEVITYVADRLNAGAHTTGVREAISSITEAAHRVLGAMIRHDAPAGTRYVLAPDDIRVPPPSRGVWRE